MDYPRNGDSPRDYDCPGDGNTPRTCLATLYDVALPRIMMELQSYLAKIPTVFTVSNTSLPVIVLGNA